MPYEKTTWVDEAPASTPVKYAINGVGGAITGATIEVETPITPGTPVNAANLNKMENGIATAQSSAETAQALAATKITKPSNPSYTSLVQQNADGSVVTRQIQVALQIQMAAPWMTLDTTLMSYMFIPSTLNGFDLVRAQGFVEVAGNGSTTVQVRTIRHGGYSLLTPITFSAGGLVGTPGVIQFSRKGVITDDKVEISVVSCPATPPKGLWVLLEYRLP